MSSLVGLLLAASVSGDAALRHASALAALGPHPWGSARNQAAAAYVAAQLRDAGLAAVELQPFERQGVVGANVIATLPAPGEEFVVIGAHHDTVAQAPGAYDDGGGVGVLIELARVLARDARRPRTLVFASFDGEESSSAGKGSTRRLARVPRAAGTARARAGGGVPHRHVGMAWRPAGAAPDRVPGPAPFGALGDRAGLARGRGASSLA